MLNYLIGTIVAATCLMMAAKFALDRCGRGCSRTGCMGVQWESGCVRSGSTARTHHAPPAGELWDGDTKRRNLPFAQRCLALPCRWCVGDYCAITEEGTKPGGGKKKKKRGSFAESFAVVRSSPKVRWVFVPKPVSAPLQCTQLVKEALYGHTSCA